MKKLLKQPWFWLLLMDILFLVFNAVALPIINMLEGVLPEKTFFALEEYYAFHLQYSSGWQAGLAFIAFLAALICGIWELFARKRTILQKLAAAFGYLLLALFSLGLLMPMFGTAREKARRISCGSNLKQICLALHQYAIDYDNFLPPSLEVLKATDYLNNQGIYRCPSHWKGHSEFSDYLYFGKDRKVTEPPFLLLEDRERNHPGNYRNRMFSDGNRKIRE